MSDFGVPDVQCVRDTLLLPFVISKVYEQACKNREFQVGDVLPVKVSELANPRFIINFPTKAHWKHNSKIEYIESGLKSLVAAIHRLGIKSIAFPPLGCGLGL